MHWTAIIEKKGEVEISGLMTYTIGISCGGSVVISGVDVSGKPDEVQGLISDKVKAFAASYETASGLPAVGEELVIIADEVAKAPVGEMSYNVQEETEAEAA